MTEPIEVDDSVVDPASISIAGQGTADNNVTGLFVTPAAAPAINTALSINNFAVISPFSIASGLGFQNGSNTVAFETLNSGTAATVTGLYATFTLTATCRAQLPAPAAVPAVGAGALGLLSVLAAAAGGLGLRRSRRRKA